MARTRATPPRRLVAAATRLVKLGSGKHYLQEDHPDVIGDEVAAWAREHGAA